MPQCAQHRTTARAAPLPAIHTPSHHQPHAHAQAQQDSISWENVYAAWPVCWYILLAHHLPNPNFPTQVESMAYPHSHHIHMDDLRRGCARGMQEWMMVDGGVG